ncbi:MAG: biotin--[acetyl-CoA-carboxylase] ligase [Muribaculaceae bacterium]|nr:biotin--[acetyl-CoA-carboxylase] ligase [Muribaculaceae bacterium]
MEHHFIPFDQLFLPPKDTLVPAPERIAPVEQLPPPQIIWLDEARSTHMLLKEEEEYRQLPPYTMVAARRQTCGRGQRGNSWESEDYRNLTFSMAACPDWLHPARQFALSEAVALSVVALLQEYGIGATVKWPNDIYVGHRKICGILIDHSIQTDRITRSILSAGLNVNQLHFISDAPNPVSMLSLLPSGSAPIELEPLARRLQQYICHMTGLTRTAVGRSRLHEAYMRHLYLNDGAPHPFYDHIDSRRIMATIADVAPDGTLTLLPEAPGGTGEMPARSYLFKEVSHILPDNCKKG